MIYYAIQSCTIDGKSYNGGEVVPESVLKHNGEVTMHLVRREGETVSAATPNKNGLTSKAIPKVVEAKKEEVGEKLPDPIQTADKKDEGKDNTSTPKAEENTTVTPAPKDGDVKKDSKEENKKN